MTGVTEQATRSAARPEAAAPARPRRFPPWVVVMTVLGAVVAVNVVVLSVAIVTSFGTVDHLEGEASATGVSTVRVEAPTGEVTVVGEPGRESVEARWTLDTIGDGDVTPRTRDDALEIDVDCPTTAVVAICAVDLTVLVPADTGLDVTVDSGAVRVSDVAGEVAADVDTGDVTLTGLTSAVVDASVEAGEIDLELVAPPRDVVATAEFGAVRVLLPDDGTVYDVTATAEFGSDSTSVLTDPDAERSIVATTEFGDVEVRPARR